MRGRSGIEEPIDKRKTDPAVERNAPADMPVKGFLAFKNDEGAYFIFR